MARIIENPVTVVGDGAGGNDSVTTHPAFGQIAASRVSGYSALYGSDFRHNAYMTITIHRSQLNRNLSSDWHYATGELIEVALTEAQWATFVSAPNVGSGVPCTIQHIAGARIPGLPEPEARADQFAAEMKEQMARVGERISAVIEQIDTMGLPARKAEKLKFDLGIAVSHLASNVGFVAKSFDEHMEETVEKAKAEVHGYMTGALMRSGLAALQGSPPLEIAHTPTTPEKDG